MQRVLVIHDDPAATSASIKRGLVYEGYSVDTAARATVGLTRARCGNGVATSTDGASTHVRAP